MRQRRADCSCTTWALRDAVSATVLSPTELTASVRIHRYRRYGHVKMLTVHVRAESISSSLGLVVRGRVDAKCSWFRFAGRMFHDGNRIWGAEWR